MTPSPSTLCTAFDRGRCIATGTLSVVALATKIAMDSAANSLSQAPILIFDDATSDVIELDWRGSVAEFQARMDALSPARGPGRPRLGVMAREITLLPRHWDWLSAQPGGASVALRKLVEGAKRTSEVLDRVRAARAAGYKFMSTIAGHEPRFEEASRALFAGDPARFEAQIADWPADVQAHLKKLLTDTFNDGTTPNPAVDGLAVD